MPDKPTRADMDQAMKEHWDARERYYEAARDFIRYRGGDALTEQALFERSLQAGAESAEALNRFVDIARKLGIRTPRVAAPAAPGPSSVPGITGLEDTLATGGSSVADSWWSIPWPK